LSEDYSSLLLASLKGRIMGWYQYIPHTILWSKHVRMFQGRCFCMDHKISPPRSFYALYTKNRKKWDVCGWIFWQCVFYLFQIKMFNNHTFIKIRKDVIRVENSLQYAILQQ
jgi:hypothetical protein